MGAVQDHLAALKRNGSLTRQTGKVRGFGLSRKPDQVMIYGRIITGNPVLSEENFEGTIDGFYRRRQGTFSLRVFGENMTGAGIREGDIVIVKNNPPPTTAIPLLPLLPAGPRPDVTLFVRVAET